MVHVLFIITILIAGLAAGLPLITDNFYTEAAEYPTIKVAPDVGFYPFTFYPDQNIVHTRYLIDQQPQSPQLIVSVWDCFCPEDRYAILDGGLPVGMTVGRCFEFDGAGVPVPTQACTLDLFQQPMLDASGQPLQQLTQQQEQAAEQQQQLDCFRQIALYGGQFCYSRAILEGSSSHNLTIKIQKSPFSFGSGYIRVDTACKPSPKHDWTACCLLSNSCNFQVHY